MYLSGGPVTSKGTDSGTMSRVRDYSSPDSIISQVKLFSSRWFAPLSSNQGCCGRLSSSVLDALTRWRSSFPAREVHK